MYAHCDGNNFYASCERVFNPGLNGQPVVVLSNNDGCIIARSNEAKALGLKMGQPVFQIMDFLRFHRVQIFSANFALYGDMSRRMVETLRMLVPAVEVYSIDEAFMDLRGMNEDTLDALGREFSATVKEWTGLPVSVGIAPTKTLAKIAGKLCKKYPALQGSCFLRYPQQIEKVLRRFPVEDVWGIGHRWDEKLKRIGVTTAWDFTRLTPEWVRKHMTVVGLRLWKELQGTPCLGFEQMPSPKKQLCVSRSFPRDFLEFDELHTAVAAYASRCAEKLRAQGSVCRQMQVFILTNRFREDLPQYCDSRMRVFTVPTDSTLELVTHAVALLREMYRKGYHYKKAGVILSEIGPKAGVQAALFDTVDRPRHDRLMQAMDYLNRKEKRGAVHVAAHDERLFPMHQEHLSRSFTTSWEGILRVECRK